MAKLSPLMILPPVVFAAFAGLAIFGMNRDDPDGLPSTLQGREAPAITAEALTGHPGFTDADLRDGELHIVNFWASWCPPCRAEHINLLALQELGVPVMGINSRDDVADAQGFLDELGNPFAAIIADPQNRNGVEWGVVALPESFVIDGQGKIVLHYRGPITKSSLQDTILPAIDAAQNPS